jgi:pyruvate dehydrogenase E1 component alpha subunit
MVASDNIADRSAAYGIPGVLVDGQDVIAMYEAVTQAVARARAGQGPSLIEGRTYRYYEHSLGLNRIVRDPYRGDDEVEDWKRRDPILIHKERLLEQGIATQQEIDRMEDEIREQIQEAITFARESPYPEPSELFEDMFADAIPLE